MFILFIYLKFNQTHISKKIPICKKLNITMRPLTKFFLTTILQKITYPQFITLDLPLSLTTYHIPLIT